MFNCVICVDDVNPAVTHKLLGTDVEKWFADLNRDYGCKFTLFVPANYHNEHPISQNTAWAKELLSVPYFEVAAHGYFHNTSDPARFGECEFAQPLSEDELHDKLDNIFHEWSSVDYIPRGWRNPGWLCSPFSKLEIEKSFKYAALHSDHNRGMSWAIKEFFGHTGIHLSKVEVQDSSYIAFQSHIYGNWNDNTWTENTLSAFRRTLDYITKEYQISFKTFNELL